MPASRCWPRPWRRRSSSERATLHSTTRTGWTLPLLIGLLVAGCGSGAFKASPGQVVQGYEAALATGGYASACNFLTPKTQAVLARKAGKSNCAAAIASCLPDDAIIPKKDQSQLLYANVVTTRHGSGAEVSISGNPVARAIGRVSLKPKPGGWILTSYGEGFTGCSKGHAKAHGGRRH